MSSKRFAGYRQQGGTPSEALSKYVWNILLCESLYPGFQILEVAFRNATHAEIAIHAKNDDWLLSEVAFLYNIELKAIREAKLSMQARGLQLTEDDLIAELSFGFWTSLLDSPYDRMWHKIVEGVFPNMPRTMRTRRVISVMMNKVRKVRNAAFHHHSLWHWKDLTEQHQQMRAPICYICAASSAMAQEIDRFPEVYANGPKGCMAMAHAMLAAMDSKPVIPPKAGS